MMYSLVRDLICKANMICYLTVLPSFNVHPMDKSITLQNSNTSTTLTCEAERADSYIWAFYELFFSTVPIPTVTLLPSGPIQGATVDSPQMIQCGVSTVSGVESSSVMISWIEPGGDTILSDMTISGTTGLMSTLNIMYLMEGTYTCNVMILDTSRLASVELETLTSES